MDLRKVKSQKKLGEALAHHLQTRTIDEITIGQLAKTAGVSRQTFYANYDSKQSILLSRIEELFHDGQQYYESIYQNTKLGREEVVELGVRYLLQECDKQATVMRAAFTGEAGAKCLSMVKIKLDKLLKDRILFLFQTDLNNKQMGILSDFVSGALIGTIQGWLLNDSPVKDMDFTVKQVGQLLPHGIDGYVKYLVAKKGAEL